ncbi:YkvA family protein [Bradyrhizobium sp. LHD-71]|uniref:YkvA family protein n=1 Tax=Bradyrhizobium sp. LHD-71 TaxID=3072141 RepID=UPI00280F6A92|nr:YkvA family protein [Bradyrhizobium sp. LHD-71]MDQ8729646.1 YkvA family protein [Bradyrhizobium sp. LHD-71]
MSTTHFNADDFEPAQKLAQDSESVRKRFKAKFKRFAARLPFAEDLLAAYYCAFDRTTPRRVQLSLLAALAYFVLPLDFMPDLLPVLGFTDDAAVLMSALRMVASNIRPDHREAARRALVRGVDDKDLDAALNGG